MTRYGTVIEDWPQYQQVMLRRLLKDLFPWIDTDENVDGAEVISQLSVFFIGLPRFEMSQGQAHLPIISDEQAEKALEGKKP